MTLRPKLPARIPTGHGPTDQRARELEKTLRVPLACPLLDGVFVEGTVPDVGDTVTLTHGLGRVPKGYLVVDARDNGVDLYRESWTEKTITLGRGPAAFVDAKFTLWVF